MTAVAVPPEPETLSAPQHNRDRNPKTVLAACAGRPAVSAKEASMIALAINDLDLLRRVCPLGFEPFAQEVEQRLAPLFA